MRRILSLIATSLITFSAALPAALPANAQVKLESGEELRLLTDDELVAAFSGKTHYGTYKEFREKTGTSSYTEHTKADGTTIYKEGDMVLKGKWKAVGDRVCFRYEEEIQGVHCFIIFEAGTCLYGYNPGNVNFNGPISPNYWNAKSIRKGDVSTCDDLLG